jgi:hypothetical protein
MFAHWIRSLAILTLALVGAAWLPASLTAQRAARADPGIHVAASAPLAAPTSIGPRVASTDVVRWTPPNPFDVAELPQDRVHAGPNIAMMAVGGAGLVIGLIIGGDGGLVIAATGGVVGLIGLYRYLR